MCKYETVSEYLCIYGICMEFAANSKRVHFRQRTKIAPCVIYLAISIFATKSLWIGISANINIHTKYTYIKFAPSGLAAITLPYRWKREADIQIFEPVQMWSKVSEFWNWHQIWTYICIYIANILPILVIFCKEITKHFGCDIFWVFYIQKTNFYVLAYLRYP
jgi:hypothetical protein